MKEIDCSMCGNTESIPNVVFYGIKDKSKFVCEMCEDGVLMESE